MFLDLSYTNRTERRIIIKELRVLFAVSLTRFFPPDSEMAKVLGIGDRKLEKLKKSKSWKEAEAFWYPPKDEPESHRELGDLKRAERNWAEYIREGIHINNPDAFKCRRDKSGKPQQQMGVERLHWSFFPRQTFALLANHAFSFVVSISVILSVFMGVSHE